MRKLDEIVNRLAEGPLTDDMPLRAEPARPGKMVEGVQGAERGRVRKRALMVIDPSRVESLSEVARVEALPWWKGGRKRSHEL